MTRYAHFVGSLPAQLMTDDAGVLQWFVDQTRGRPVTAIPRDLDPDWMMDYLLARAAQTDVLKLVRPGDYSDYGNFPSYGVRAGRTLEPRHLAMNRVARIDEAVAAFQAVRAANPALAETKLQVSQPNPLDLALFLFAGAAVSGGLPVGKAVRRWNLVVAALRQLRVFADAVVQEMAEVIDRHGDTVVWQLETPVVLLGMVKAKQLRAQWALGPLLVRQLAGFLGRMHGIGADTIVHLCYGDYQHKSMLSPRSLAPAVALLNGVAPRLERHGTPLPPVHIPCAFGAHPAPLDPRFYAPLRKLDPAWRVIAGVVSPDSAADSARALELFEQAADRTAYGVATACGLGRCTPAAAQQAAATMLALADTPAAAARPAV